jgi:DNA-binding response OmpR family regulator
MVKSVLHSLERVGHTVTAVASGEEALEHLRSTSFDLAILDLKLGGRIDGLRVLQAVKWQWYVYRLRRKVEPNASRPHHILNVRGLGYTLKD